MIIQPGFRSLYRIREQRVDDEGAFDALHDAGSHPIEAVGQFINRLSHWQQKGWTWAYEDDVHMSVIMTNGTIALRVQLESYHATALQN